MLKEVRYIPSTDKNWNEMDKNEQISYLLSVSFNSETEFDQVHFQEWLNNNFQEWLNNSGVVINNDTIYIKDRYLAFTINDLIKRNNLNISVIHIKDKQLSI